MSKGSYKILPFVLSLFSPVQDEKNQILTTNAWLNLVSVMLSNWPKRNVLAEQTLVVFGILAVSVCLWAKWLWTYIAPAVAMSAIHFPSNRK